VTEAADRVAKWYIFRPKITAWSNFEGLGIENVGILFGRMINIMALWYDWGNLLYIFPLVCCTKQNLATLAAEVKNNKF
jgi:hypothetical protein